MKRSEMQALIGLILVFGKEGLPLDKREKYKDHTLADIILSEMEEEGMLPPTSKEGKWIDCGNGQGFVSYNVWDKEVEE